MSFVHSTRLAHREWIAHETLAVQIERPEDLDFLAGQYVDLTLRSGTSLANVVALARQEREQQEPEFFHAVPLKRCEARDAPRRRRAIGTRSERSPPLGTRPRGSRRRKREGGCDVPR